MSIYPTRPTYAQTAVLLDAAEDYREACLIQAAILGAYGDSSRDSYPSFSTLHQWLSWSFDHTHACAKAVQDAAIGEPVWSNPSPEARAAGSMPVRIF